MRSGRAAFAALLLLFASPAWAAWGLGTGQLMNANDKNSKTQWAPTTGSVLEVGNVGICVLAVDNISTANGETSDHTTVTDDAGNTWDKRVEFSNLANSNAACTVSIWSTVATSELSSGAAITFNISAAKAAWAAVCKEFTLSVGDEVTERDKTLEDQDNTNPGNINSGTVADIEHLWFHGMCGETSDAAYTASSGYTNIPSGNATTSGGGSAGNMAARGDFRIFSGTSQSHDPQWADAPDYARALLAFEETTASTRSRIIDIQ